MATSTFDESLSIEIDSDAQQAIAKELGSLNKFYDRLAGHVASETDGAAKLVPAAQTLPGGDQSRGGGVEIVAAVIKLAHALGLQVVAEGVERPEQLEQLAAMGCDFAQGYLFARPMPVLEVTEHLSLRRMA